MWLLTGKGPVRSGTGVVDVVCAGVGVGCVGVVFAGGCVGVSCTGVGAVCTGVVEGVAVVVVVLGEVPLKVEMEDCGRWDLALVVAAVGLC